MDADPPDAPGAKPRRLLATLERMLGPGMGVRVPVLAVDRGWSPVRTALFWLALYAVIWLTIERFAVPAGTSQPKLVSLIAWGACYFAGSTYLGVDATLRFLETVRHDILPHASSDYEEAVAAEIDQRFGPVALVLLPLLAAAASVAAMWWAIGRDTGRPVAFSGTPDAELILLSVSYFIYFYVAAVAVVAARFYSAFACNLEKERKFFYVMGAADTPLVKGLSKLGTQVLTLWALIFLVILSSMLLAFVPFRDYELTGKSTFLFLLVPIAGFFSLGFGSLIYLKTEARIRATLQRFVNDQVKVLQKRSDALIDPLAKRVPDDAETLKRLTEWQDRILAGGRYGSRAGTGVSIALPFLLPLLTLVLKLFGKG